MKHVIWIEIRKSVLNFRFVVGAILLLIVSFLSEESVLKSLVEMGGSTQGPGWFVAYSYYTNGINELLFIPIVVTFAAGGCAEEEICSRFSLFSYSRVGKQKYYIGKAAGLGVSGGLLVSLVVGVLLISGIVRFGHIPILIGEEMDIWMLCVKTALGFIRMFLDGMLWALVGGIASLVTRNRYMAYTVPFVLYYVMNVFQERYYPKAYILNPRYWVAPIYYNDYICVVTLLCISSLMIFLFIWSIKRRISHA